MGELTGPQDNTKQMFSPPCFQSQGLTLTYAAVFHRLENGAVIYFFSFFPSIKALLAVILYSEKRRDNLSL